MVTTADFFAELDDETKQCAVFLRAQLAHSRQQRELRRAAREREARAAREAEEEARAAAAAEMRSVDSASASASMVDRSDSASIVTDGDAPRAVKTLARRKPAAKVAALSPAVRGRGSSGAPSEASGDPAPSPSPSAPRGAAELRRARLQEQHQQREDAERRKEEEAERKQAALKEAAQEKGGWLQQPAMLGRWKKCFYVARKNGLYWYSAEPKGRGSARGGVSYDASAKPDGVLEWFTEVKNSRGGVLRKEAILEKNLTKEDHKQAPPKSPDGDGNWYFGVQHYVLKKEQYEFICLRTDSAQSRDEWAAFIAPRFVKMRKSIT